MKKSEIMAELLDIESNIQSAKKGIVPQMTEQAADANQERIDEIALRIRRLTYKIGKKPEKTRGVKFW